MVLGMLAFFSVGGLAIGVVVRRVGRSRSTRQISLSRMSQEPAYADLEEALE